MSASVLIGTVYEANILVVDSGPIRMVTPPDPNPSLTLSTMTRNLTSAFQLLIQQWLGT